MGVECALAVIGTGGPVKRSKSKSQEALPTVRRCRRLSPRHEPAKGETYVTPPPTRRDPTK
eukprot:3031840-Pyramimonas_sp.AAC.1